MQLAKVQPNQHVAEKNLHPGNLVLEPRFLIIERCLHLQVSPLNIPFTYLAVFPSISAKDQLCLPDEMGKGFSIGPTHGLLQIEEELLKVFGFLFTQSWISKFPIKVISGFVAYNSEFVPSSASILNVCTLAFPLQPPFLFPFHCPYSAPFSVYSTSFLQTTDAWMVCKDGVVDFSLDESWLIIVGQVCALSNVWSRLREHRIWISLALQFLSSLDTKMGKILPLE